MTLRWEAAGATDVGRVRTGNEDALVVDRDRGVFLVADGMGGHAAGEVASALAVEAVGGALARGVDDGLGCEGLAEAMRDAFLHAAEAIDRHAAAEPDTRGMGTTLTACALHPDGVLCVGHIGDSRAYRLRGGVLEQLTHDHTLVQREVDAGRLSPEAARVHPLSHVITRALGAGPPYDPEPRSLRVEPGDLLLLATDGLTGMVDDDRLARLLASPEPPDRVVRALIDAANAAGGVDNVTAIVVRVLG